MSDLSTSPGIPSPRAPLLHFDGLVPLVVGVAGHRDPVPAELPRIRAEVEQQLVRVLALGGRERGDDGRRETPILVVSSLAEGADRLVARIVLDRRDGEPEALTRGRSRLHLAAILPMAEAEYEATFDGTGCPSVEASIADYRTLVARAHLKAVLPPPAPDSPEAARPATTTFAFERMAAFLAWHSHVMLALWNGLEGRPGGTTDSVRWFTGVAEPSFAPPEDCIDAPDGLSLLRIVTPRVSAPGAMRAFEDKLDSTRSLKVFRQIEGFNRDVVDRGMKQAPSSPPLPAEVVPYQATYAAADGLSGKVYRKQMEWSARILLALVIASVLAFEAYSHILVHAPGLMALYVVLSTMAILWSLLIRRKQIEEHDLVFRSFAEALRVQGTWASAGLDDWVGDHYAPLHHNELEWVRQAMKGLHALSACARGKATSPDAARIRAAVDHWVVDQGKWLHQKHESLEAKADTFEWWAHAATGLAQLLSIVYVLLLAVNAVHEFISETAGHRLHGGVLVAIVLSLAGAGLIHQWSRWKSFKIAAKAYDDAAQLFDRASAQLEDRLSLGTPRDIVRAQQILRALGASALAENTSWLLLHRDHVLEIHH